MIRSRTSTNTHEAQILAPATAPPGRVAVNVLLSPVLPSSEGHVFQVFNVVLPTQDPTKQNQHSLVQTSGICYRENSLAKHWFSSSLRSLSSSQYLHFQPCFFGETEVGGEKNILVFNLSRLQLSATEMSSGAKRQAPPSPMEEALTLHLQLFLQEKNMQMLTH